MFLELRFKPVLTEADQSILVAALLQAGFDSFSEEEDAILAYISVDLYNDGLIESIGFLKDHPEIKFDVKPLEDINWNKEWESNYPDKMRFVSKQKPANCMICRLFHFL